MLNTIAGLGSAAGSLISSIGGLQNAHVANSIEKQNLAFQKESFGKSYAHQLEQYDYSKDLQQQLFNREDNSIQRRIADLKAAGLSPVLAAGQGARAGAVVPTKAPQSTPSQRSIQGKALTQQALSELGDVGRTFAETKLILAQADKTKSETLRNKQLTQHESLYLPEKLEEILNKNEYANRTMETRILDAENIAKRNQYKATSSWYNLVKDEVDAGLWTATRKWLLENNSSLNNPHIVNIMTARLLLDIKKYDYELFKKMGQPVQGNMSAYGLVGGGASKLVDILQELGGYLNEK